MSRFATDAAELAQILERSYIRYMRQRGYSSYDPKDRHRKTFQRVAELCLANSLDPDAHVRALVFQDHSPVPNKLLGARAVERTRQLLQNEQHNVQMRLRAQLFSLSARLRLGYSLPDLLVSPYEDFSPAFRFLMATRAGLKSVADAFLPAAHLEVRVNPALREALRVFLPSDDLELLCDATDERGENTTFCPPSPGPGYDPFSHTRSDG